MKGTRSLSPFGGGEAAVYPSLEFVQQTPEAKPRNSFATPSGAPEGLS
jgi:hypothetical protein